MATFAVVLVIETDATDGDPVDWRWQDIIDIPGSVGAVRSVSIPDEPNPRQRIEVLKAADIFHWSVSKAMRDYTINEETGEFWCVM